MDVQPFFREIITVDVDDLDRDPKSIIELLREGECDVKAWLRIAIEYWRLGNLDTAMKIADEAREFTSGLHVEIPNSTALSRIYSLLANIALERARNAPKIILSTAQNDVLRNVELKSSHYARAAQDMNFSQMKSQQDPTDVRTQMAMFLTRANFLLSTRDLDAALSTFEQVLILHATNIPALIGKARIYYTRRQYREALRLFQRVLTLKPYSKPDPRVGIGLCLWALGNRDKARAAWKRSTEVNPDNWASELLLGLEAINSSHDSLNNDSERRELYKSGLTQLQRVFKLNMSNAASANVLSDFFLRKGDSNRALKLAERTIQYADTLAVLTDGHIRAARVAHAQRKFDEARAHYSSATEGAPKNFLGNLGVAQMQVQNDEILAAIHSLETVISESDDDLSCLEGIILLASLRAFARPALSPSDAVTERIRSRELYDRVMKAMETRPQVQTSDTPKQTLRTTASVQVLREDADLHVELAFLWELDNIDRATKAMQEAIRINESHPTGQSHVLKAKLRNNLAALYHLKALHLDARILYEEALPAALEETSVDSEAASVTILYNLARVYEDLSEHNLARDAYLKLLSRHQEYTDAKARLAMMRMDEKRYDEAHNLVKQALSSGGERSNEVRGFYIWLLCQTGQIKVAKAFTFNALKEDGHDVYALCAAGRLTFNEARESRDSSAAAVTARKDNFLKAANIYAKALSIDPSCAIAAQGLAIIIAEDSLGGWVPGQMIDDLQIKNRNARNAREALDVLAKVRESLNDGSVYVNMGHCHFIRDEFDKALENYETASRRFYGGQNVSVLLYLARAWFAKANKVSGFLAMQRALKYAQMALHISPNDKAVIYNIAMIEQKAGELLFSLPPDKRTLSELQLGIVHASHAQKLFASLASDSARPLPYSQDVAQNRTKYGETLLRRSIEHLSAQEMYEAHTRARLDVARRQRQEEKDRLDVVQRERVLQDRERAADLATRRRIQRETVEGWAEQRRNESEEEGEKRAEKLRKAAARKARQDTNPSGDENNDVKKDRKRRRVKGGKKGRDPQADVLDGLPEVDHEEDDAVLTDEDTMMDGEDIAERPKKTRIVKKRSADEDEDGPSSTAPSAKRKKIKSREIIESDDDDEM